jgi:hypothetical protein
MKAYIITIIIAYFFAFLGENLLKKNKKHMGMLNLVISLTVICLLAGVRDLSIGTDVYVYLYPMFKAFAFNGSSVIYQLQNSMTEIGFIILVYIIVSIFKNINILMFVVELCVALPIYIYAYKQKDKHSISFIILIFLLTMYVKSFNLIRQSVAMSLIILSTYYFDNKEYKKVIFLTILAFSFHTSAIICTLIYALIIISKLKGKTKNILLLLVYVGLIFITISIIPILNTFFSKYALYVSKVSESTITFARIIKKLFWIVLSFGYLHFTKNNKENHEKAVFCLNLFITEFILYFMNIKVHVAGRLGYYLLNLGYIVLCTNMLKVCKQKNFMKLFLIIVLFAFWYKMTAIINSGDGTYPYMSNILTFLN